jgi:hypothetical protein
MPLLIITRLRVIIKERYKILYIDSFKDNMKFLFLLNLYKDKSKSNKGIISFFILKS